MPCYRRHPFRSDVAQIRNFLNIQLWGPQLLYKFQSCTLTQDVHALHHRVICLDIFLFFFTVKHMHTCTDANDIPPLNHVFFNLKIISSITKLLLSSLPISKTLMRLNKIMMINGTKGLPPARTTFCF